MPKNSVQVYKQDDIIQYVPYQTAKTQSVQKVSQVVNSKYIGKWGSQLIKGMQEKKSENLSKDIFNLSHTRSKIVFLFFTLMENCPAEKTSLT